MDGCPYLFLAVSTAFTITDPFVPGNFTYSNFGAGAGPVGGAGEPLPASVAVFGVTGCLSSDRLAPSALVRSRGRKREGKDGTAGGGDDASRLGAVDGRAEVGGREEGIAEGVVAETWRVDCERESVRGRSRISGTGGGGRASVGVNTAEDELAGTV